MGKHNARDDSAVDPLVADALARRGEAPPAAHGRRAGGSTGWPGPAPGGGGAVGWPDELEPAPDDAPQEPADSGTDGASGAEGTTVPVPPPGQLAVRRGWRRLFGASPAA